MIIKSLVSFWYKVSPCYPILSPFHTFTLFIELGLAKALWSDYLISPHVWIKCVDDMTVWIKHQRKEEPVKPFSHKHFIQSSRSFSTSACSHMQQTLPSNTCSQLPLDTINLYPQQENPVLMLMSPQSIQVKKYRWSLTHNPNRARISIHVQSLCWEFDVWM